MAGFSVGDLVRAKSHLMKKSHKMSLMAFPMVFIFFHSLTGPPVPPENVDTTTPETR
jgi:hypothetical protein